MLSAQGKIDAADRRLGTVVIDAGHGGKDPGCVWGDYREKDLNLKVALLLGRMIEDAYPDVSVVYTRKDDRFIELFERGDIANRAGADLFISIHTDAVSNPDAHGSSTYIMGNDKAEKNLAVAQRENSVIVMESDYEAKYEGYDPSSAESFIIFSLMQYAYSEQSMVFAELVQQHYKKNTPVVDRGARQAPYLVLWRTAMPSVLTEIGFLTNAKDRAYLVTEKGQKEVAKSLFDAFSEYRARCNSKADESTLAAATERPAATAQSAKGQDVKKTTAQPSAQPSKEQEVKKTTAQPSAQPAKEQEVKKTTAQPSAQPAKEQGVKKEKTPSTPAQQAVVEKPTVVEKPAHSIKFYAQICTLAGKSDPNDRKFGRYRGRIVQRQTPSGKWRCLLEAESLEDARRLAREAQDGFKGAFVVAFDGDEYLTVSQAQERIKQGR